MTPCQPATSGTICWRRHEPIPDSPVQAPDSLLSLVYTSGSTGKPKGAMLSVERYAWSCEKLVETVSLSQADRGFSYLPLAHITERVYIYGGSLYGGATIAFPESLDTFIEDVKRCRPTVFISVPRLWAMFRIKIHEKLPQNKLALLLKIPALSPALSNASCKRGWDWIRPGYSAAAPRLSPQRCLSGI